MPLEPESTESGAGFAQLATTSIGSDLISILMADDIVPGSPPSYQLCKTIYTSHPLGQKIAEGPITIAQSQEREIELIEGPKSLLLPAFQAEWKALDCDTYIKRVAMLARIYGIATLAIGGDDAKPYEPLDLANLHKANLSLSAFDPLNTAGSLVLNQDPNASDFQRPTAVRAGSQNWHPSRTVIMLNESPIYIDFTPSAFGFVGRSVYQRALFPLKSYINSIIADDAVLKKIALLIWKSVPPSSAANNRMFQFFGWKRQNLKTAVNGQVLTIGDKEDIQSLNFNNLEGAGRFARENVLKNIAVAAGGMPAALLHMETLTEGFGEGTEDAKQIAAYIDRIRIELDPLYDKLDGICMRRAWSPDFYRGVQREIPELRRVPYESALRRWMNGFRATWPNLLTEPDSEKSEVAERQFKSVVALIEVLSPLLQDPDNKAALVQWAAEQASDNELLFTSPLEIDPEKIREWKPEVPDDETAEPKPRPFANAT